jgi:hypothetical protein
MMEVKPEHGSLAAAMVESGRTWNVSLATTGEHLCFVVADSHEKAMEIAAWTAAHTGHGLEELRVTQVTAP